MTDLMTVLADAREELSTLRRNKAPMPVERVDEILDAITAAAEPYLLWLSEGDAATRAGRSVDWIKGKYRQLEREGHARTVNGKRQYRALAIPQRAHVDLAAARGRQAARQSREERRAS